VDGQPGDAVAEQPLPLGHHGTAQGLPAAVEGAVAAAEVGAPVAPAELRRYVAYSLVSSIGLTNGIWVIYLKERGLSLGEIGDAEAFFHLAPITLELPTGTLAHVLGPTR
jgi:hypothetical protein